MKVLSFGHRSNYEEEGSGGGGGIAPSVAGMWDFFFFLICYWLNYIFDNVIRLTPLKTFKHSKL